MQRRQHTCSAGMSSWPCTQCPCGRGRVSRLHTAGELRGHLLLREVYNLSMNVHGTFSESLSYIHRHTYMPTHTYTHTHIHTDTDTDTDLKQKSGRQCGAKQLAPSDSQVIGEEGKRWATSRSSTSSPHTLAFVMSALNPSLLRIITAHDAVGAK